METIQRFDGFNCQPNEIDRFNKGERPLNHFTLISLGGEMN
jgi:hypothetical protein